MFLGELSADGYGFALLDVRDLSEFLKERKCRAKKLLSYWDAHKQLFYDAVKGAKAYPSTRLRCAAMRSSFAWTRSLRRLRATK
nr:hypothetical protein [uncultured Campylobacter sp.]